MTFLVHADRKSWIVHFYDSTCRCKLPKATNTINQSITMENTLLFVGFEIPGCLSSFSLMSRMEKARRAWTSNKGLIDEFAAKPIQEWASKQQHRNDAATFRGVGVIAGWSVTAKESQSARPRSAPLCTTPSTSNIRPKTIERALGRDSLSKVMVTFSYFTLLKRVNSDLLLLRFMHAAIFSRFTFCQLNILKRIWPGCFYWYNIQL